MKKNYSNFYQVTFVRDPDRKKINTFLNKYTRHIHYNYYQLKAIYDNGTIRYLTVKDSLNGDKNTVFTKIQENVLEFQYSKNMLYWIKGLLYTVSDPDDLIIVKTDNPSYKQDTLYNMIRKIDHRITRIRFKDYKDKSRILQAIIMDKRISTKDYMINSIIDLNGLDIVIQNRDYLVNIILGLCKIYNIQIETYTTKTMRLA